MVTEGRRPESDVSQREQAAQGKLWFAHAAVKAHITGDGHEEDVERRHIEEIEEDGDGVSEHSAASGNE